MLFLVVGITTWHLAAQLREYIFLSRDDRIIKQGREIALLEADKNALRKQVTELERILQSERDGHAADRQTMDGMKREVQGLRKESQALKSTLAEANARQASQIAEANAKSQSLTRSVEEARLELSSRQRELEATRLALQESEAATERERAVAHQANRRMGELQADIKRLRDTVASRPQSIPGSSSPEPASRCATLIVTNEGSWGVWRGAGVCAEAVQTVNIEMRQTTDVDTLQAAPEREPLV
jgi:DNA repair exonuclease SbcCD ATPase subunit